MSIFKYYFRIAWQRRTALIIYAVVFLVMATLFSMNDTPAGDYSSVRVPIYLVDESETKTSKALVDFLSKEAELKSINAWQAEDELFYGTVDAIITIPKDFASTRKVLYQSAPKSSNGFLVHNKIEQFVGKINFYQSAGYTEEESIANTLEDLGVTVEVSLAKKSDIAKYRGLVAYFNFLNYPLSSQILLIVSTIMAIFNRETILNRHSIAPVTDASKTMQLFTGHILLSLVLWLAYSALAGVYFKATFLSKTHLLLSLNSFVLMACIVAMAIALTKLVTNENAIGSAVNVIALASSFLSGAFVPRFLLGNTALALGRIFPSFYYVENNERLLTDPDICAILPNLGIMLGISAILLILSMFVKPKAGKA